jgi:hypothetical protein
LIIGCYQLGWAAARLYWRGEAPDLVAIFGMSRGLKIAN